MLSNFGVLARLFYVHGQESVSASCVPCACEGACEVDAPCMKCELCTLCMRSLSFLFYFVCLFSGERIGESLTAFGPRGLKRGFLDFGPRALFFGRKQLWRENFLCCLLQSMMRSGPKPSSDFWQPVHPLIQNSGRPSMPVNGWRSRPRLQVSEDGFKIAMHKP